MDYRDVLLALAGLYVRAEGVGIKPNAHFRAVAPLSSADKPGGGDTPTQELLIDFRRYGALRERRRMERQNLLPGE